MLVLLINDIHFSEYQSENQSVGSIKENKYNSPFIKLLKSFECHLNAIYGIYIINISMYIIIKKSERL